MARRKSTVSGARRWLGTLLVAWTFVTGCALVLATAHYQTRHDLRVLLALLGAPFLIGLALFIILGIVVLVGHVQDPHVEGSVGDRKAWRPGRR